MANEQSNQSVIRVFCHSCGIENPTKRHDNKCIEKNLSNHTRKFCIRCGYKIPDVNLMCNICYCTTLNHIQWCDCERLLTERR